MIRECKQRAKAALGGKIFGNVWLFAVLAAILYAAIEAGAGTVIPGLGIFIIMGPISYGISFIFLKNARTGCGIDLSDLFRGFKDDFGGTLLIGLMSSLFSILWGLLLVIPGIVKAYGYSMAYYIKIDHPDYDWRTCLSESQRMMKGHKMQCFLLDLSFIGWFFVSALCLAVGSFWVIAWVDAATAEFYEALSSEPQVLPDWEVR